VPQFEHFVSIASTLFPQFLQKEASRVGAFGAAAGAAYGDGAAAGAAYGDGAAAGAAYGDGAAVGAAYGDGAAAGAAYGDGAAAGAAYGDGAAVGAAYGDGAAVGAEYGVGAAPPYGLYAAAAGFGAGLLIGLNSISVEDPFNFIFISVVFLQITNPKISNSYTSLNTTLYTTIWYKKFSKISPTEA